MEEGTASSRQDGESEEEFVIEFPILGPTNRVEKFDPERATIIRDFAYTADDPLFWRLDDGSEARDRPLSQEADYCEAGASDEDYEASEGSGFKGAPPWLQPTTNEDGSLEDDHMSHALDEELHGRAVALFDFTPEHENEFPLSEGQVIYISSRHGLGWLVAVDLQSGDCGLVPEEYVRLLEEDEEGYLDDGTMLDSKSGTMAQSPRRSSEHAAMSHEKDGQDEWVDDPDISLQDHDPSATTDKPSTKPESGPQELSDKERQKIMDAAEREMSLVDAKLREGV